MVFRPPAALPVQAMQTYRIAAPLSTHTRPASCAEAGCQAHAHGWITKVDERTDLGMAQAAYIRAECVTELLAASPAGRGRRRYLEHHTPEGLTEFRFPAGQQCFAADSHRVPLERPQLFLVQGGDHRARTGLIRRHDRPEHWVEDFSESLDRTAERQRRG
jgi:hypothetical protein